MLEITTIVPKNCDKDVESPKMGHDRKTVRAIEKALAKFLTIVSPNLRLTATKNPPMTCRNKTAVVHFVNPWTTAKNKYLLFEGKI